jgi:hypothetical protein
MLQQVGRMGVDPRRILLMGAVGVIRVKALAVTEATRGHGVGAALLAGRNGAGPPTSRGRITWSGGPSSR